MEYKSPKPLPVGSMVIMSLSQRFRLNTTRDSAGESSSFYFYPQCLPTGLWSLFDTPNWIIVTF